MRDITEDHKLLGRLFKLTDEEHPDDRCYVYRIKNGKPVRPAVLKCIPRPDLIDILRDRLGGGDFQIMIRRGSKMLIAGLLRIAAP
jgi:hypothetical protein